MTIYEQLQAAGVPLDHHKSDLYAKATETACKILDEHKHQGRHLMTSTFVSQVDGELWYDIPLAYDPWWVAKATAPR